MGGNCRFGMSDWESRPGADDGLLRTLELWTWVLDVRLTVRSGIHRIRRNYVVSMQCPTLAAPIRDRLDPSKLRVQSAPLRRLSACIQHKEYLSRESLSPDML